MTSLMAAEVAEIPDAVARLWDRSNAALEDAGRALREREPAVFATIARGSSDQAAVLFKYATEIAAGVPVASIGPSVASVYDAKLKLGGAASLAISQSGKSPDIVAAQKSAGEGGALTIAITNNPDSPLAREAAHAVDIAAGPERSVAATKTFVTSAAAGLGLLAHWQEDQALLAALHNLPETLRAALDCDWSSFAQVLAQDTSLFILGRGPAFAVAGEAALKFKETCGMHAESYSAAEVMHGPMALVTPGFPVLAFAARDRAEPYVVEAVEGLAAKGAAVFATTDKIAAERQLPFVATGHPLTDPLALITAFYRFAEELARARGLDPDRPPHLRKVTETR